MSAVSQARLLRRFDQRQQSAGQQVARRAAAGVDQQQEEQQELHVVERAPVDLGGQQLGGEVVGRPGALLGDHLGGVLEHLGDRLAAGAGRLRLRRGMDDLGQLVELAAVVERQAHQLGDHERWHFAGDVGHEVALAPVRDRIDDLLGQRRDPLAAELRRRQRELAADQLAEARVLRRVHHQHHLVGPEPADFAQRVGDHDGGLARVGLEVAVDGPDVVVAGHRPEAAAVRLLVPVDRGVFAQPAELLVRLAGREARGGQQVDVHGRASFAHATAPQGGAARITRRQPGPAAGEFLNAT